MNGEPTVRRANCAYSSTVTPHWLRLIPFPKSPVAIDLVNSSDEIRHVQGGMAIDGQ
jgi:hypothetical protein